MKYKKESWSKKTKKVRKNNKSVVPKVQEHKS